MEFLTLYLIGESDNIKGMLVFASFLLAAGWAIRVVISGLKGEAVPVPKRPLVWAAIVFAVSGVIPSGRTLALILGGKAALDLASSDRAGELADNTLRLVEKTIAAELEKLDDKEDAP